MTNFLKGISVTRGIQAACIALGLIIFGSLIFLRKPWEIPPEAWSGRPSVAVCLEGGIWWAALTNAGLLILLGLAAPFWNHPLPTTPVLKRPEVPRWFWIAVGIAMLTSGAMNAPRLGVGFWDDEEYSVRRSIAGTFREQKNDTLKFRTVKWRDTIWYYAKPNNHMLNSALARASNDIWKTITTPQGLPYSEVAIRLPAFLAGVSSLGAMAWLLLRLGYPGAGALAAWLLAIHPWHARFVPEARGYAFVFLILPLCCLFALNASQSGRWRWWIAYGVGQFLLMAAWPGSVEFLIFLNAGVLGLVLHTNKTIRWISLRRFVISCLVAGMATLLLLAPCVPQFIKFSQEMQSDGLTNTWFINVASRFLTGFSWTIPGAAPSTYPNASHLFQHLGFFAWVMMALAAGGLLLGILRLVGRGTPGIYFLPLFLLSAPLFLAVGVAKNLYLLEWYVVGALPGLVALVAIGLTCPMALVAVRSRMAATVGALALCGMFLGFQWNFLSVLHTRPISPIRESVLLTRPDLNPHTKENQHILTAGLLALPWVYDPRCQSIKTMDELLELMKTARDSRRPLFINQSYTNIARQTKPEVIALLFDSSQFEHIPLIGIEPMFDRDVFIYRNRTKDP
ncbi:MAG: hypothetical protein WEB60_14350 [Terrimicrobiaceae bacterium]